MKSETNGRMDTPTRYDALRGKPIDVSISCSGPLHVFTLSFSVAC